MEIKVEKVLQGDLVTIRGEYVYIIAIVNFDNWFRKVTLLRADGANLEFAKVFVLEKYREYISGTSDVE